MTLISDLGDLAVRRGEGTFTKGQLVQGMLSERSVTLCGFNTRLEQSVRCFFVNASRHCLRHGLTHPTADVEDME
jgi:hypothetical protein